MRAFPLPEPAVIHARSAALLIDDHQQAEEEETEAMLAAAQGGEGREATEARAGRTRDLNIALGMWIATVANRRAQRLGEDSVHALTWVQEWVDVKQGAYRALGSPYGDDDVGLLRWLEERNPFGE